MIARRALLAGAAAAITPRGTHAAPPPRTPYTDRANVEYGLTAGGSVRPCPIAVPNCASSSATNDLYAPPLLTRDESPAAAADAVIAAAERRFDAAVRSKTVNGDAVFVISGGNVDPATYRALLAEAAALD